LQGIILLAILLMGISANSSADIYDAVVSNAYRSDEDKKVDARRKPAEILRFFDVKPKMSIFDVFAGGGYYTELLSLVVGHEGSVVLYNNGPWDNFVAKSVAARLRGDRLANVELKIDTPESLLLMPAEHDLALFVLGMHDVYYADAKNQWPLIDKKKFLKGIYNLLKDGGVLGVIDADAIAGTDPAKSGKDLHRVDPSIVIKDFEEAGFTLIEQSYVLANRKDDMNTSVFLPENRYNTNRSVLKFKK
jgi:predicted methyltransferase